MSVATTPDGNEIERLCLENYNSSVVKVAQPHDELMIIRVRPDRGVLHFQAGQYTVLGLGYWEPRVAGAQEEPPGSFDPRKIVKRAYSMSCSMLDDRGNLVRAISSSYLEFYITLVRRAERQPPALTPRLFKLREGDRIFCGPHVHGHYTLRAVGRDDCVIFAATGTGEAPHNAMLADLLATGHRGQIVMATCVRRKTDLAYLNTHRELEHRYVNYRYLTLTTREPENLDATLPGYIGRRYLQDYFMSGDFERDAGIELSAQHTHVFLCGNPTMIGVPHHTHDPARRYPQPLGLVEVLERRGFCVDQPHEPGNIHFEKYW
jgi:ferredoxin--NADP+ reductase